MYTTRPDTLFGATYMVVAPEHPLLAQLASAEQARLGLVGAGDGWLRVQAGQQGAGAALGRAVLNAQPLTFAALPLTHGAQAAEVEAYVTAASKKSDFERTELAAKNKSGVFTGALLGRRWGGAVQRGGVQWWGRGGPAVSACPHCLKALP